MSAGSGDTTAAGADNRPAAVLPPLQVDQSSIARRLTAAHREWREVMEFAAGTRSTTSGIGLFLAYTRFINAIVKDEDLRARMLQDFEVHLRAEFPAEKGKLL